MKKSFLIIGLCFLLCAGALGGLGAEGVFADSVAEENRYYLGETVNTGLDTGYSEEKSIDENDPHFGWKLGSFYMSGYTRATDAESGCPVFLKNVGDRVTLWFSLEQDITKLNGKDQFFVCEDSNGFDRHFGIERSNFGKGTLVIRHTDHQNKAGTPTVYTDYLSAKLSEEADVRVELLEEGDYEVALNYEVQQINMDILGWQPFPSYYNYRIFFHFSVRNGNCMVFPFDVNTGEELSNTAVTPNGFYLDLAKSKYLNIDIKKEIMTEGAEGLTEDIRFNRPAKDGEAYTEEGVYTFTVKNKYTGQETTKKIYVGTDDVLRAYVVTGMSIPDIKAQIALGATVSENGTLILPDSQGASASTESKAEGEPSGFPVLWTVLGAFGVLLVAVSVFVIVLGKKKKASRLAEAKLSEKKEEGK